jgi:hypothetical protein
MYGRCGFDRERAWRWLNNMYWREEFEPYTRSTISDHPMTPRREMLAAWRDGDHPRIHFASSEVPIERRDDGTIIVELSKRIVLPEQTDEWNEQHLIAPLAQDYLHKPHETEAARNITPHSA